MLLWYTNIFGLQLSDHLLSGGWYCRNCCPVSLPSIVIGRTVRRTAPWSRQPAICPSRRSTEDRETILYESLRYSYSGDIVMCLLHSSSVWGVHVHIYTMLKPSYH